MSHPELLSLLPKDTMAVSSTSRSNSGSNAGSTTFNVHSQHGSSDGSQHNAAAAATSSSQALHPAVATDQAVQGSLAFTDQGTPTTAAAETAAAGGDEKESAQPNISSSTQAAPQAAHSTSGSSSGQAAHVHELLGERYSLVGADLRHLHNLEAAMTRAGYDSRYDRTTEVTSYRTLGYYMAKVLLFIDAMYRPSRAQCSQT